TGDTVYGGDRRLRMWLEEAVLGVKSDEALWCGLKQIRAAALASQLPADAWQRLSAGEGTKGLRWYDWAALSLPRWGEDPHWQHALLVRCSLNDPSELAFYVVFAPAITTLADWVRVAGQRWTVESCFEHAKDELGLDQYEVRHWTGWYRHITLVMLAQIFLNALRLAVLQVEKKEGLSG
ncbi:MAG: IS701 family transposase, partial [Anaerolineae bacterium]|nr:IS701 family transposase [Anaerolineae bacterium]